ncbi:drug resistance transporter, EmrB/QacA subfamily [Candidatus Protofrankia californiensis]|uniref:Drug resistance transporter, EmrB/QacA subfamily n=1 Tax=Candidatus Protofrankia californiensis TaxID=1839754 RepID=A0A1C3NXK2_9ACTN|nr:drug resistance transporter, EmrB/QacA subfamily [Candidatus Protofrankia californiensis]
MDSRAPSHAIEPELKRMAGAIVAGTIMTILDTTIVNVAVNTLARDFATSLSTVQWTLTGYTLALSMSIPLTGWTVRRFGAKTMWITALALFIAGSALCGLAWSVAALIGFRILQGIGGGLLMPVGQAMLARAAGPRRMGRMMSVISVPAMFAPVAGPVLGGLLVGSLSWRWMFLVNLPVGAFAMVLAIRLLPADQDRETGQSLDTVGLLLLSPGLAALVYGLSQAGDDNLRMLVAGGAGLALVAAFSARALRMTRDQRTPLIDLTAFRDRAFTTSVLALFVYSAAVFGLLVVLPIYYQTVQGRSPLASGLLIAPLGLDAVITLPIAGKVTDRAGPRGVALSGLLTVVLGTAIFTQLQVGTNVALLVGALFVVGLGHGLITPSLMAGAFQRLSGSDVPSASTTANVLARLGTSVGTAALAVTLQIYIRAGLPGSRTPADAARIGTPAAISALTDAFANSMWWTAGIAALALMPTVLIPPRRPAAPARAGPARDGALTHRP